jgi:hypothetical protein
MNMLERMGQNKIPSGMTQEDVAAATKEATSLEGARSLRQDYTDSFNKLNNMVAGGAFSPNQRDAYVNALAAKLAKQSAGRYNLEEAKSLVEGMFPGKTDTGAETRAVKFKKGMDYFDSIDAETPTLNRFGLKNETPSLMNMPGQQTQTRNGVTYVKVNGGWKKAP